jgi:hypothetical protein
LQGHGEWTNFRLQGVSRHYFVGLQLSLFAYQKNMSRPHKRSANDSIGKGDDMKKLLITGFAPCFMGLAMPSFASLRQDQAQQDQMKNDDAMKKDATGLSGNMIREPQCHQGRQWSLRK